MAAWSSCSFPKLSTEAYSYSGTCSLAGLLPVGNLTILSVLLSRHPWDLSNVPQRSELNLTSKLLALTVTVPTFGVFCSAAQLLLFGLGRTVVLPFLFKIPILSHLLRPFSAHFLKGYTPVLFFTQFPTILRALFLGITTLASWEVSETLFDTIVSEVHSTPSTERTTLTVQTAANHCRILYSGALCNTHFRHFFRGWVLQVFCIPRVGEPVWGSVPGDCRR